MFRIALSRAWRGLRTREHRVLGLLACALTLAGTAYFASRLNAVYPIRLWLFWNLAVLWGWQAALTTGCVSTGLFIIERGLRFNGLPPLERAVLAMAVGLVAFTLAMYVAGALAWFGPVFATLLPLGMAALGIRCLRELWVDTRAALAEPRPRQPLLWVVSAFGLICVGLVYLPMLTPDALNYDSTWCHLTISQDYARAGRIVPFVADYSRNVPQLASLVHTWGYLVPGLEHPALRWMMVLHAEFALFLWTLAGVSAAVRWLTADAELRGGWAAFFLFPFIFVYDHNMAGAADHVLAFFAVPLLLATRHVWTTLSPSSAVLFGVFAGGALLTKYQAIYLVVPLGSLLAARWLAFLAQRRQGSAAHGAEPPAMTLHRLAPWAPLISAGAALLVSAPQFVKNAVFYDNPVYPFLQNVFHSNPTVPDASLYVEYIFKDKAWVPQGSLIQKLGHAAKLFFTFSFEPHYSFTNNYPGFGSLFTLLLPGIMLVRPRRHLALAAAAASGGVLLWALIFNVDRNLQIVLPLIVCTTAALVVMLWRLGWVARIGLVPLVALQVVWGGDAFFYSSHGRISSAMELVRSGFEGRAAQRFDRYRSEFVALGKALPADARVLLHASHVTLGIDREVVLDWTGFQGLIHYGAVRTPRELHDYYRSLGVTHLVYVPRERPASSRQEEVLWNAYVTRHAKPLGTFGPFRLMKLAPEPPAPERPYRVASFGLPGYADGIYPIEAMSTIEYLWPPERRYRLPEQPLKPERSELKRVAAEVDAVFIGQQPSLERQVGQELKAASNVVKYPGQFSLYLLKH